MKEKQNEEFEVVNTSYSTGSNYLSTMESLIRKHLSIYSSLYSNAANLTDRERKSEPYRYYSEVKEFLDTYTTIKMFPLYLTNKNVPKLWKEIREYSDNVVSFILQITTEFKLIYATEWNLVLESMALAFGNKPVNGTNYIDVDLQSSILNAEEAFNLFSTNHWLVTVSLISLIGVPI